MQLLDPVAKHVFAPKARWSKAGISLVLALAATSAGAGIAAADGDAPAGNNGHIFIDEHEMTDANGNDPHVACGFSVTFYGYDAGDQSATITVNPWSPTDGGEPFTVATSWHTDERTGGNQLDANQQISPEQLAAALDGIEPAKQGFHVRVNVNVTGSQGADAKHKMLWVEPCEEAETPAPAATPAEAADAAAVDAIDHGATNDEATVAAHAAAMNAGATSDEADVLAAAAVAAAGGSAESTITPALPAVPLALAGSTTG